nr:MAG TPA: hypothetical protein [Caudoviricetes sp.]
MIQINSVYSLPCAGSFFDLKINKNNLQNT